MMACQSELSEVVSILAGLFVGYFVGRIHAAVIAARADVRVKP